LATAQDIGDEKRLLEASALIRAQFGDPSSEMEAESVAFIDRWGKDVILNVGRSQSSTSPPPTHASILRIEKSSMT